MQGKERVALKVKSGREHRAGAGSRRFHIQRAVGSLKAHGLSYVAVGKERHLLEATERERKARRGERKPETVLCPYRDDE